MRQERIDSEAARPSWHRFADFHAEIAPPLSPSPVDIGLARHALGGRDGDVVLLGVTPALATIGARLHAFDQSARMVAEVWPGDDQRRSARVADWRDLPLETASIDGVVGDGALNSVAAGLPALLRELSRIMKPGGRCALRCFAAPATPETLEEIAAAAMAGRCGNFHALKWRLGMALAAGREGAVVQVPLIRDAFMQLFPHRDVLAAATGWPRGSIDSIDFYVGADHSLAFPSRDMLLALAAPHFAAASFLEASGYPLAERCPTLVLTR